MRFGSITGGGSLLNGRGIEPMRSYLRTIIDKRRFRMLPKNRPIHPGEFIKEDILIEFGLTQQQLADRLKVHRRTINEIVKGKRGISADMALRLGKFTNTNPRMWLNLQNALDLWDAYHQADQSRCIDCISTAC
jgi:addiction module HigA family antidote